jgi:flagellar biosynthesis protein FlhB
MAEQEQNRSEPATPFRLQEARKRGSVAKSLEVNSLLTLFAVLVLFYIFGVGMIKAQLALDAAIFSQAHLLDFQSASVFTWLTHVFSATLAQLAPVLALVAIVAILGTLVQTGPVLTFFPLKPQFDRLNPVAGFKRVFSMRMLFELGKNVLKLALIGWLVFVVLRQMLPRLLALLDLPPVSYTRHGMSLAIELALKILMVLVIIALLDLLYTRRSFFNRLKMSRRELKEEIKNREGDPRIRARMRQLQREMGKRGSAIKRLPDADVLITNPTHLAVALLYKRETMLAPQVLAKGAGEMAQHMKVLARRHRIPVIENRALARKLFQAADLEQAIPEALFPQVARILVWAYAWRNDATGGARSA